MNSEMVDFEFGDYVEVERKPVRGIAYTDRGIITDKSETTYTVSFGFGNSERIDKKRVRRIMKREDYDRT